MVEDSFCDARLIYEMLRDSLTIDFKIEQAFRLSTGLEMLKTKEFDIILLDLALPDSFGLDTLKCFLNEARGIPIVVMTANDDEELGIKAVHLGAQDYIIKLQYDSYSFVKALCFAIERKKNEEILAYQTKLLNSVNDGIAVTDNDLKIVSWNTSAEKIFGWKENEVIGNRINDLIDPLLFDKIKTEAKVYLDEGKEYLLEINCRNRNGDSILVEMKILAILSKEGIMTGLIFISRELENYKTAIHCLQDNPDSLLQPDFDNTNQKLVFLDQQFNIVRVNKAFSQSCQLNPDSFIGRNIFELLNEKHNKVLTDLGKV